MKLIKYWIHESLDFDKGEMFAWLAVFAVILIAVHYIYG